MKTKLKFYGWEPGVKKIDFIRLLNDDVGIPLREAKRIKDNIIDYDQEIIIEFDDPQKANEIRIEANRLGIKCKLID